MIGESGRPGFQTLTPYLMVERSAPVVAFLQAAFRGEVVYESTGGSGGAHVEIEIGDARLMIGGDVPGMNAVPVCLFLYVEDTDAVYESALRAGATSMLEPGPNFEESRGAAVRDPFGNQWFIATHDPENTRVGG